MNEGNEAGIGDTMTRMKRILREFTYYGTEEKSNTISEETAEKMQIQYEKMKSDVDKFGNTILIAATTANDLEMMEAMIASKADVNVQNNKGNTALMMAVVFEFKDAVKLLLDAKADPNIENNYQDTAYTLATDRNNARMANVIFSRI